MVTIDKSYGTPWCSDYKRTKTYLGEQWIPFNWIDIDADEESAKSEGAAVTLHIRDYLKTL